MSKFIYRTCESEVELIDYINIKWSTWIYNMKHRDVNTISISGCTQMLQTKKISGKVTF